MNELKNGQWITTTKTRTSRYVINGNLTLAKYHKSSGHLFLLYVPGVYKTVKSISKAKIEYARVMKGHYIFCRLIKLVCHLGYLTDARSPGSLRMYNYTSQIVTRFSPSFTYSRTFFESHTTSFNTLSDNNDIGFAEDTCFETARLTTEEVKKLNEAYETYKNDKNGF